ncbi:MAG: T9SS type A sorting domain-containing protein [Bacteroidales bacterium]|nr:T9SS type A sorting domain-containing protein [Bacteroidales bacterium]
MKKVLTMIAVLACTMIANAQNYEVLHIEELINGYEYDYCADEFDGIIIHKAQNCPSGAISWSVNIDGEDFNYWTDSIILHNTHTHYGYYVGYSGCSVGKTCAFLFHYSTDNVNPFVEPFLWKRTGESTTLVFEPMNWNMEVQWSTGETENEITVTEPGTYSVTITDACGSETYTIQVRDDVEIYRAGVDPATNKNRVLWQTTPEQAQYVSQVKVERDGMVVGTVPYTDGEFLDNIGSENAARIYRITGIASDGTECPIPSYQFGTFNTIISPDIANPSLMNFTWEDPFIEEGSPYSVVAYRIGRFNESTGEFVAIDQLSANVHIGKYNMDLFDGDYGIVAAVFNDAKNRDYEELAFSNRSDNEILAVGENEATAFKVYPNPANGVLFVETVCTPSLPVETYRIMNPIGQTVMQGQITSEKQQIDVRNLPNGVYFITVGGATRKFVVE